MGGMNKSLYITVFVPQMTGVPDETGLVILNWSEMRNKIQWMKIKSVV